MYQDLEKKALEEFREKFNSAIDPDARGKDSVIEQFWKSHLKEAYEAGKEDNENIATPQYKKDMQDAYEDGIAEERSRLRKWAEENTEYAGGKWGGVIQTVDLLQELI